MNKRERFIAARLIGTAIAKIAKARYQLQRDLQTLKAVGQHGRASDVPEESDPVPLVETGEDVDEPQILR